MPLDHASGLTVRFFCAFDPDGTCVEFIEQPGAVRLMHVNVNCPDLDRSTRFYQDVLGLAPLMARSQPGPVDGRGLGFPGKCQFRADFLALPGRTDLIVDLLEWLDPCPSARPRRARTSSAISGSPISSRTRARAARSSTASVSRTRGRAGSTWAPTSRSTASTRCSSAIPTAPASS